MKQKTIYTAPACEAVKLELDHPTLQVISTKRVMFNFYAFDYEGSDAESLTW